MCIRAVIVSVLCLFGVFGAEIGKAQTRISENELVILVHGFARSSNSMWLIEKRLQNLGYETCTVDYQSREQTVTQLVNDLHEDIAKCSIRSLELHSVHFVTHSLGGPLVRAYLEKHRVGNLGRVVMLSPPSQGTPIIDLVNKIGFALPIRVVGPTASRLSTGSHSWLRSLSAPDYEVGVIAGSRTLNPFMAYFLPGEDDGVVPVSNMKFDGMADFVSVKSTHVTIRYSNAAFIETVAFLKVGRFGWKITRH